MTTAAPARIVALDAARGTAIIAMVAFHLIWDLGNFGYIDRDFPYSASVKLFGHAIAIAFRDLERVADILQTAPVRDDGREPCRPLGDQGQRLRRLVVGAAHVEQGHFLAPHIRGVERH